MAELILYTNPMSRGADGAMDAGEGRAGPALTRPRDRGPYGPEMKSASYRAINPMGKVPALVHGRRRW